MGSTTIDVLLVCAIAIPFVVLTRRLRLLTLGGGVMAALIALAVVVAQGWILLAPLFLFLISSVLLGRLNKRARTDAKHGKPRDAMQVFCNGGIYALLALADDFHAEVWMAISICTATCDTWASEIGMYAAWPTVDIARWRRVPPGLSGGVSLAGTLGGLAGSMLMGIAISSPALEGLPEHGPLTTMLGLVLGFWAALHYTAFAMGGMLLDSLLGALLQVRYDDGHGPRDAGTRQVAGFRWMTNDAVNLISNALTVGMAMALLS